jgi:hypothetical protein
VRGELVTATSLLPRLRRTKEHGHANTDTHSSDMISQQHPAGWPKCSPKNPKLTRFRKSKSSSACACSLAYQKRRTPPSYISLIPDPPTHHPTFFLFLDFYFSTFLVFERFSAMGSMGVQNSKTPQKSTKMFLHKVHKKSTKVSMSVFPRLPLFYRVFGCFSAMRVQKHTKKRFTKNIVSKSFSKQFDHRP